MNRLTSTTTGPTTVTSIADVPMTKSAAPKAVTSLPSPVRINDGNISDALGMVMALESQISQIQTASDTTNAKSNMANQKTVEADRLKAAQAAIDEAKKAQQDADDGGIFGFVTKNIGVVGLIGICTGQPWLVAEDIAAHEVQPSDTQTSLLGAAAALAGPVGCAIELGIEKGLPSDWTKPLQDLPQIKDDDVRLANKVALTLTMAEVAVATTLASGGSAAPAWIAIAGVGVSTVTEIASETGALRAIFKSDAQYVTLGGELLGAGLTLGASAVNIISSLSSTGAAVQDLSKSTVQYLNISKSVVEGADAVRSGVRNLQSAADQHDSDLDNIEATKAKQTIQRVEMIVDDIIDSLQQCQKSASRASQTIQSCIQANNQTSMIAITGKA